jgi:hypothetical protein
MVQTRGKVSLGAGRGNLDDGVVPSINDEEIARAIKGKVGRTIKARRKGISTARWSESQDLIATFFCYVEITWCRPSLSCDKPRNTCNNKMQQSGK